MEDWEVSIQVSADPPKEDRAQVTQDQVLSQSTILGQCKADPLTKNAVIWVSGIELYSTLGHEMMHVLAADLGIKTDTEDRFEFTWSKLGDLLADSFSQKGKSK